MSRKTQLARVRKRRAIGIVREVVGTNNTVWSMPARSQPQPANRRNNRQRREKVTPRWKWEQEKLAVKVFFGSIANMGWDGLRLCWPLPKINPLQCSVEKCPQCWVVAHWWVAGRIEGGSPWLMTAKPRLHHCLIFVAGWIRNRLFFSFFWCFTGLEKVLTGNFDLFGGDENEKCIMASFPSFRFIPNTRKCRE